MKKKLLMLAVSLTAAFACVAAQCQGITKKGTQCKRQASPDSAYCWQHGGTTKAQRAAGLTPNDVKKMRCKAITKAGTQCKRTAQTGSEYCWQHSNQGASTNAVQTATTVQEVPVTSVRSQCTATTKSGKRCSRMAQPGSDKCWQHQ